MEGPTSFPPVRGFNAPPSGRCAQCPNPAAKWVGRIDEMPDGRILRRGVGVCESCFERITAGTLDIPERV